MVTKEEVEYEDIFVRIICSCQLSYKTLDKIIHMHYRKLAKSRCMSLFDLRPGYWCFVERLNPSIRMWQSLNYMDIILQSLNEVLPIKQVLKATANIYPYIQK